MLTLGEILNPRDHLESLTTHLERGLKHNTKEIFGNSYNNFV